MRNNIFGTGFVIQDTGENVWDASLRRIRMLYENFDTVVVSFSGGKDSTVILMLTLLVARELGRLPLPVVMFDEEVIDPDTIALCEMVREWDDLDFRWMCLPVRHTIRSLHRSFWYTWDPDEQPHWARPLPPYGVSFLEGFVKPDADNPDNGYGTAVQLLFSDTDKYGQVVELVGVRTQEAFNRKRAIVQSGAWYPERKKNFYYAKPIFDWTWQDVWLATSGSWEDHANNQPLQSVSGETGIVHNGNVYDYQAIYKERGYLPQTACDSEALFPLMGTAETLQERLHNLTTILQRVPYAILVTMGGRVGAVRWGHPLYRYAFPEGVYLCSRSFSWDVPGVLLPERTPVLF